MVPGFASVLVSRFMELFRDVNGAVANIGTGCKSLWSCYMYSIDGINRGCARPRRFGGLEMKLCSGKDKHFSDLTNVSWTGCPERTFWHILTHFCEILIS